MTTPNSFSKSNDILPLNILFFSYIQMLSLLGKKKKSHALVSFCLFFALKELRTKIGGGDFSIPLFPPTCGHNLQMPPN